MKLAAREELISAGGASRYPIRWYFFDMIDGAVEKLVPTAPAIAPFALLLPAIVLIGLLIVGLGIVADQSLRQLDVSTFLLGKAYTLANYAVVLERSHYRELFERTAMAAVAVAVICLILGFPYAYVMVRVRSSAVKKLLLCCIFLPFLLGGVVRGYAWLVVLGRDGIVNTVLASIGFEPLPLIYNMTGVLIGLVQLYLPIAVLMMAPALTAISEEVDEAAQSLGARWPRILWTVILPVARPGLASAFVVVLTLVFSDMAVPMILGGGRADFISNEIYSSYLETGDRGIGAALCMATTIMATGSLAMLFAARSLLSRRPA